MQNRNKRAMPILFLTMFIVMVGFGVIMPILPFYAEQMGASATDLGLLLASYSVVQFFFSPLWGQASDRFGRKPVILLGLTGFAISFFLFGFASQLWMLFGARILGGLLSAATLPTVLAYIADTTNEKERGGGMGVLGAAMGMGVTFGPVIGGYLGEISQSLPFFASAALALAVAVFAGIFLPESRRREEREKARQGQQRRRNGLGDIWSALGGTLGFVKVLAFLASFANANLEGTFALFSEVQLGFGEAQMGTVFGVMGITMALTQGLLVGWFINRFGEERLIQIGLIFSALGFLAIILTFNMASILIVMSVMGLGNASLRPAVNSLVSKRTLADEQGRILGVVNSYNSLGRVFGPVLGGMIFDLLGFRWPYIVGSVIFFITLVLSAYFFKRNKWEPEAGSQSEWSLETGSMD